MFDQKRGQMMRRFSCVSEAVVSQIPSRPLSRRISQQDSVNSALQFLERRKSSDSTFGELQPNLYRRRGSVISIGSREGSAGVSVGRVQLQLCYDFAKSDFVVQLVEVSLSLHLEECRLRFSIADSTLKRRESLTIFNGTKQLQSATIYGDQQQTFKFPLSYDELLQKCLIVELVSDRPNGTGGVVRHGYTSLRLCSLNPSDELLIWVDLDSVNDVDSCGELLCCLQYLPSAERLTLTIHQAANLRPVHRRNGESLQYTLVRASLISSPDDKLLKKKKSNARRGAGSPQWNEALLFSVDPNTIAKCRLEVQVVDCDRFGGSSRVVGQVIFGPSSTATSLNGALKKMSISGPVSSISPPITPRPNSMATLRLWREALDGRSNLPQWVALEKPPQNGNNSNSD